MQVLRYVGIFSLSIYLMGFGNSILAEDGQKNFAISALRERSAREIYEKAKNSYENKLYATAIYEIEALLNLHPSNAYAESAHVMRMQCYLARNKGQEFVKATEKFAELYPRSQYATTILKLVIEFIAITTQFKEFDITKSPAKKVLQACQKLYSITEDAKITERFKKHDPDFFYRILKDYEA